jgi:hypothetical protein
VGKIVAYRYFQFLIALLLVPSARADAQRATRSGASAFAIEAAGATVGSLAGVTLGLAVSRIDRCDSEDLACILSGLSVGGVGGVVGATVGTLIVGRQFNTRPSTAGAIVGSIVGVAAGLGVVHLMTEEATIKLGRISGVLVFSATQGLVTAVGSRIGATIRDR